MRSNFLVAWWGPSGASWVQLLQSSPLQNHLDLKPTIKGTPVQSRHGAAEIYVIHNMGLQTMRIGGKTLPDLLLDAHSTLSTKSTSRKRASIHPL
jgi:hypothetical protein